MPTLFVCLCSTAFLALTCWAPTTHVQTSSTERRRLCIDPSSRAYIQALDTCEVMQSKATSTAHHDVPFPSPKVLPKRGEGGEK
ncbi:hypothetical protein BDN71DRAFT_1455337 [Pleurotus eryngii]|uniref:Secreted protein n=1 Tax=Pleurotus eryngii TaxID=5323 RepID=A0A9P5ZLV5_PLEER|nr:hypothetical protein BDN71DRAFT_1455337 [Pleurotus eryngii]